MRSSFPGRFHRVAGAIVGLACGWLGSDFAEAASNDKRVLGKYKGLYKGSWSAAGNLPLSLRMPKGKGSGDGSFEATPCNPADAASPLAIRITRYQVRRNGKKLISTGKATWERSKVPALVGPNLTGKLKVIAVLRGNKPAAKGSLATGTLAGGLNLRKGGSLPAVICTAKAFALPGDPVILTDNATTTVGLTLPNAVPAISDLDVVLSIGSVTGTSPFNSDYDVVLRHVPSGVEIELFTDVGFDDDGIFVRLDDDAATGIETAPDDPDDFPIIGVFKPETPAALAAFNGVLPGGRWELAITDDSPGLTGALLGWTLHVE